MVDLVKTKLLYGRYRGRILIGLVAILVLLVVGAVWAFSSGTATKSPESDAPSARGAVRFSSDWFTVERRSFDLTVIASGELEARNQVELKSLVESATTIVELVPEGKMVQQGEVLLRLADENLREKIQQETVNVERSRADKVAAEQNLAIQQSEADTAREEATTKLALAELDLHKWRSGDDPQKQRELNLALEKAKRTLTRAKRDLELSRQLAKENFISQSELEDDELAAIEAESALETAQMNIEVYEKYTRPKEERKIMTDVESARAALDRTIRKYKNELERYRADLVGKTGTLQIYEDRLAKWNDQLACTVIRAPQDGLVVYASSVSPYRRRGDPIALGRQVRLNETLILLPDTRQMVASLKVHEAMLPQVRVEQKVSVTIDARPAKPIEGKVSQIAVMAEDGGWFNPDLREYVVKIELPAEFDKTLKPAMRCAGQIQIGRVESAIAVPVQAIFTEGERRFCYRDNGSGRVVRSLVKIGRASESFVEITSGLDEGDQVLLRKPRPGEVVKS